MAFENIAAGTAAFNLADTLANTRKESRDDFTNNFNIGSKLGGMVGDITADVKYQGIIDKEEKLAKQQAEAQAQQQRTNQSVGVLAPQQSPVQQQQEPNTQQSPPINKVQSYINTPLTPEGKVNPLSPAVFDTRAKITQRLIQEGKIPESYGNQYLTRRSQEREAFTSNLLKTQANLDALANADIDSRSKSIQAKATLRGLEDNNKYVLYQTLLTEGKEAAQKVSDDNGFGYNLNNPKELLGLESGAKRSQLYFDSAKNTAGSYKPVSGGFVIDNKTGQMYKPNADGTGLVPASGAEIQAFQLSKASSGSPKVNVNTSDGGFGLKPKERADFGEFKLASQRGYNNAGALIELQEKISEKYKFDGTENAFQTKIKELGANFDNDPDVRKFKSLQLQMVNDELRLNKGTQVEGDVKRALTESGAFTMDKKTFSDILGAKKIGYKQKDKYYGQLLRNETPEINDLPEEQEAPKENQVQPISNIPLTGNRLLGK